MSLAPTTPSSTSPSLPYDYSTRTKTSQRDNSSLSFISEMSIIISEPNDDLPSLPSTLGSPGPTTAPATSRFREGPLIRPPPATRSAGASRFNAISSLPPRPFTYPSVDAAYQSTLHG